MYRFSSFRFLVYRKKPNHSLLFYCRICRLLLAPQAGSVCSGGDIATWIKEAADEKTQAPSSTPWLSRSDSCSSLPARTSPFLFLVSLLTALTVISCKPLSLVVECCVILVGSKLLPANCAKYKEEEEEAQQGEMEAEGEEGELSV